MSIHHSESTTDSTTLKTTTSRTIIPDNETENTDPDDVETIGFKLCEFCESKGTAQSNPDSVCECTPITRSTAAYGIGAAFDLAMRIAEHAVIEAWSINGGISNIEIERTHIGGGVGGSDGERKHDVKISFDGTLWSDVTEPFTCEYGTAELWGITGDGDIHIGVTLADEYTQ